MTSFWWLSTCFVLLTVLSDCSKLWTWKATEVFPDFNRDRHWFLSLQKMDLEIPSKGGHVQSFTYAHCGQLPPGFWSLTTAASSGPSSSGWRLVPHVALLLAWYVEGTTWSLSRRIANPRSTNSVESQICWMQKWHVVGLWHWIMKWNWCNWCRFRFSAIFGPADGQPTYTFSSFVFFRLKRFHKISLQLQNEIKETKHRVDHLLDEILGICDSLLFDFLSDQCCRGPHRRGPMYRGVFLQHCIWFVDPYFYRMDLRMTGVFL